MGYALVPAVLVNLQTIARITQLLRNRGSFRWVLILVGRDPRMAQVRGHLGRFFIRLYEPHLFRRIFQSGRPI
jgi:hypothetical protein